MVSLISVVDKVISAGVKIRPIWLKKWLLSLLFSFNILVNRLKLLFSHLRLSVSLVSGLEKQTGETISVLFVGGKRFPVFLCELIFDGKPMICNQGNVFIWNIKDLKKRYAGKVDAVLVNCDQLYKRFLYQDFFVFPHWVDMSLDCSKGLVELSNSFSRNTKRDIKTMEEHNFSFELTKDIGKLKIFYYDMFLPTLSNRIGTTDMLTPSFMWLNCLIEIRYELMMISSEGTYVCGGFFYLDSDKGFLRYSGVLEGQLSFIKKRTSNAIYYFFILEAFKRKIKKISFGGARPFFNDGLFQYKRKWGMKVEPNDLFKEIFGLQIVRESEPLKQFLIHNPFVGMNEKKELIGFVFVDKKTYTDAMSHQLEKKYQTSGVNRLRFIKL